MMFIDRVNVPQFKMVAMKSRLVVLLLCAALLPAVQASAKDKVILPGACGDDSIKFEVKAQKDQPPPAPPAGGKAQIIFSGWTNFVVRYGLDGSWIGATEGRSYFAVSVDSGVHHLCVSPQSSIPLLQQSSRAASFTAESGKIYYFMAFSPEPGQAYAFGKKTMVISEWTNTAPGTNLGVTNGGGSLTLDSFNLLSMDETDGSSQVKSWKLAISKPKK